MWYHHLKDFLLAKGCTHHIALPCIFTYINDIRFVILTIYVDLLNLIGSPSICKYTQQLLTTTFDIKLLGRTTFCLGLLV